MPRTPSRSAPRPASTSIDVLEAIVQRIPPPKPRDTDKLQALIIDSWFDNYLGVVSLVRVMQGEIKPGDKILVMSTGRTHQVDKVGVFTPKRKDAAQARRRRSGLDQRLDQGRAWRAGRRHADARPAIRRPSRCRASRKCSRACSPACSRSTPRTTRTCARRWRSCASTTPRCASSRKAPRRWASASAAASSACCTWRSCRSAWSASTTST